MSDAPTWEETQPAAVAAPEAPKWEDTTEPQWSDLPKNIIPNAEEIGKGAAETGLRIGKGIYDLPSDVIKSGEDVLTGGDPLKTPLAQDAKTVGGGVADAVSGIPQQFENLMSKPEWIKHPVSNAMTGAAVVAPFLAPEEEGAAASIGRGMERKGGEMAADIGDVSGKTVNKIRPEALGPEAEGNIRMAGETPNPADIRAETGKKLVKEGVVGGVGQDIGDRIQSATEKREDFGKQVGKAVDDIKEYNKSTGQWENVDDPIHVQANPILKSVLDKANEIGNNARSGIRQTSRFWRETYNSLAKKAEDGAGRLNLDDIRDEMHQVGEDMEGNPNSARYAAASKIYGHLAQVREQMVKDIASQAGDPKLAQNLIDANRGYSTYSKIVNDMKGPAASGETGGAPNPQRALLRGSPTRAVLYSGIRAVKPALAEALVKGGASVAKYGSYLEAAAKQGPRNLAIADFVLRKQHPDYDKAVPQ